MSYVKEVGRVYASSRHGIHVSSGKAESHDLDVDAGPAGLKAVWSVCAYGSDILVIPADGGTALPAWLLEAIHAGHRPEGAWRRVAVADLVAIREVLKRVARLAGENAEVMSALRESMGDRFRKVASRVDEATEGW